MQVILAKIWILADDEKGEVNPIYFGVLDSAAVEVQSVEWAEKLKPQEYGEIKEGAEKYLIEKYAAYVPLDFLGLFHDIKYTNKRLGDKVLEKWHRNIISGKKENI